MDIFYTIFEITPSWRITYCNVNRVYKHSLRERHNQSRTFCWNNTLQCSRRLDILLWFKPIVAHYILLLLISEFLWNEILCVRFKGLYFKIANLLNIVFNTLSHSIFTPTIDQKISYLNKSTAISKDGKGNRHYSYYFYL